MLHELCLFQYEAGAVVYNIVFQQSKLLGGRAPSCLFGLEDMKLQSTFATADWFR